MASTKWTHVWNTTTGKYVGFFRSDKDARAWRTKQANKDELEINDRAPERGKSQQYDALDKGLDDALAAVKAEEADNAVPATSSDD